MRILCHQDIVQFLVIVALYDNVMLFTGSSRIS